MKTIARDLVNMAKSAGLEVLNHYRESSSYCVETRAPNGVERKFRMKDSGSRADLDLQSSLRRFARENAAPVSETPPILIPTPAVEPEPIKPAVQPKPPKRTILKVNQPIAAPTAAPSTATQAPQDLTTAEIIRLGEWTRKQDLAQVPNLEALALAATSHIGHTVTEQAMREVMAAIELAEPEHWHPLPDAHTILARELSAVLTELGLKPSAHFSRLVEALA